MPLLFELHLKTSISNSAPLYYLFDNILFYLHDAVGVLRFLMIFARHIVTKLALEHALVSVPHPRRYSYTGHFVEIFFLASLGSDHLRQYFKQPSVIGIGSVDTWNTAKKK